MPNRDWSASWPIPHTRIDRVERLPRLLANACVETPYWSARENDLLLTAPEVADFRITDGSRIQVALADPGISARARFLLMATPYAAQIQQRGELPLHAAGLVPPGEDRCVLLAAHSGTGKSTTACALLQSGWRVLNDDICRIVFQPEPLVLAGFQTIKLWPDSCKLLGLEPSTLPRALGFKEKVLYQGPTHPGPAPPACLIVLIRSQEQRHVSIRGLHGMDAFRTTVQQTFRPELLEPMGQLRRHFDIVSRLLRDLPVWELSVPITNAPEDVAEEVRRLAS